MLRSCLRASTVKSVALVPVPLAFVTVIGPVVAPDGTVAVIRVDDTTLNVADVPPNRTAVVPVKSVPSIVTLVPTAPLVGENDVIVGAAAHDAGAATSATTATTATTDRALARPLVLTRDMLPPPDGGQLRLRKATLSHLPEDG
jgi:hypothetical protein